MPIEKKTQSHGESRTTETRRNKHFIFSKNKKFFLLPETQQTGKHPGEPRRGEDHPARRCRSRRSEPPKLYKALCRCIFTVKS